MRSCQVRATAALLLLFSVPAAAQTSRQAPPSPFLGSVPKGTVSPEPLALSVKDAVQRALENNLGLLLQEESEATAHGARWRALADLLPNVVGHRSASSRQVINLEAYGFPADPPIVGPFNVLRRARVRCRSRVIDLRALNEREGRGAESSRLRNTASRRRATWSCWSRSTCISRRSPRAAASR